MQLQQQIVKQQKQGCGMWYSEPQMYQVGSGRTAGGVGEDAWPIQQNPTRIPGTGTRAVLYGGSGGGAAAKRVCAGTGVFLPRRYGSNNECNAYSSDSRKKPGIYSSAPLHFPPFSCTVVLELFDFKDIPLAFILNIFPPLC